MQTISSLIGITERGTYEFRGSRYEYHPGSEEHGLIETLGTDWADGWRSVASRSPSLPQDLAVLLARKFRKGVSADERVAILAEARNGGLRRAD